MPQLVRDLLIEAASRFPSRPALVEREQTLSYAELASLVEAAMRGLLATGLGRRERVAIYLEKRHEGVAAAFAAAAAGGSFVIINPVLKPGQVAHILADCGARILITTALRLSALSEVLTAGGPRAVVVVGEISEATALGPSSPMPVIQWPDLLAAGHGTVPSPHRTIDGDAAAIFYTSGSTGRPKGVVLSHRNLVAGAESVNGYLGNRPDDRLLAVLPLSFDAGFSQLTTSFAAGSAVVLLNYLLPGDIVRTIEREGVTGVTGVPPLWAQLVGQPWPEAAAASLRYLASTGGHVGPPLLAALRRTLPQVQIHLMYGLTEAFRSTTLPPDELERRPGSVGRAIPNVEIGVFAPDGRACAPGEIGEIVHRGATVALGYWNDPEGTRARFRPWPAVEPGQPDGGERAVWSGDLGRFDEDGYLYFLGRRDRLIKTSGYRVSPTEIEEVTLGFPGVGESAALGVPDEMLGQVVHLVVTPARGDGVLDQDALAAHLRAMLPAYMVPRRILSRPDLPRGPNGKIDYAALVELALASMDSR